MLRMNLTTRDLIKTLNLLVTLIIVNTSYLSALFAACLIWADDVNNITYNKCTYIIHIEQKFVQRKSCLYLISF